ncbi:hypothetical protein NWQ33_04120 [Mycoplasmopsis cynos]|nr:hypothetical protein [Mycoplasmopsis cynos]
MPKDTPEQNGNTGQSNDSKNNTQDENKEAGKMIQNKINQLLHHNYRNVTVETKSMELLMKIRKTSIPRKSA